MAEDLQGFGDVRNAAGEVIDRRVRYRVTSEPGNAGGVGRVRIHEISLSPEVAQRYEPKGPNDPPLTLRLQNGDEVDFHVQRRNLQTGKVDVTAFGGIRKGGA
jgi:hypothetical protein